MGSVARRCTSCVGGGTVGCGTLATRTSRRVIRLRSRATRTMNVASSTANATQRRHPVQSVRHATIHLTSAWTARWQGGRGFSDKCEVSTVSKALQHGHSLIRKIADAFSKKGFGGGFGKGKGPFGKGFGKGFG